MNRAVRNAVLLGGGRREPWVALKAAKAAASLSNPQINGVMSSPPTVTISSTSPVATYPTLVPASGTLVNHQAAWDLDGGKELLVGGRLGIRSQSTAGASTNWATGANVSANAQRIRFLHTGSDFALQVSDSTTSPNFYRLIVNGVYVDLTGIASLQVVNGLNYITVAFGSSATRDITLETTGTAVVFGGVMRRNADSVAKPTISVPRIMFIWDSWGQGAINDPNTGVTKATSATISHSADSVARRSADYLGCKAVQDAIGGTGFLSGSAGSTQYQDRMFTAADLANVTYDAIAVVGSSNDASAINGATITRAAFQTRANANIALLASTYPTVPIVVVGNFYKSGMSVNINENVDVDLRAAVAAAKVATPSAKIIYVSVLDIINAGNAATWLNSDGTHLNSAGEVYVAPILALRIYRALQSVFS